jgi:hypothetical protein
MYIQDRLNTIYMRPYSLLIVLTLIIRELVIRMVGYIRLFSALEPEYLVHLVHTQTLGVVNEEEGEDARADETRGEEYINAPLHVCIHAW